MMKITIPILLLMALNGISPAQNAPQKDCERMIREAKELSKGKFSEAIRKLAAAKICDESLSEKADSMIVAIYTVVNAQRERAEEETRKAIKAEKAAQMARIAEEKQKNIAVGALRDAKSNLSTAIGIQASRSLANKNTLEAIALLSSLSYNNMPMSNEAYSCMLNLSTPTVLFTGKGAIPLGPRLSFHHKPINWVQPTHHKNIWAVSDAEFRVGFYNRDQNTFSYLPESIARHVSSQTFSNSVTLLATNNTGLVMIDQNAKESTVEVTGNTAIKLVKAFKQSADLAIGTSNNELLFGRFANRQIDIVDTLLTGFLNDFDLSESENCIAATDYGLKLYIWNSSNRQIADTFFIDKVLSGLRLKPKYLHPSVKLAPDASYAAIVIATTDSTGRSHNVLISYHLKTKLSRHYVFREDGNTIEGNNYQFDKSGERIVASTANAVYVLRASDLQVIWTVNTNSQVFALSPDSLYVAVADNNELLLHRLNDGQILERVIIGNYNATAMFFTGIRNEIVVIDLMGKIKIMEIQKKSFGREWYLGDQPIVMNKKYAFSANGKYMLMCLPNFTQPITWSVNMFDVNERVSLGSLFALPESPRQIFIKDSTYFTIVMADKIIHIQPEENGKSYISEKPDRIRDTCIDYIGKQIFYITGNEVYGQSLVSSKTRHIFSFSAGLNPKTMVADPRSEKVMVGGTTEGGKYKIMEYDRGRLVQKNIDFEPVSVTYDGAGNLNLVGRRELVKLVRGQWQSLPLSIPLPLETNDNAINNFNGENIIMLGTRQRDRRYLNLMYIDLKTGYNRIIENTSIAAYADNDHMYMNMHLNPEGAVLRTISNFGLIQDWGIKLDFTKERVESITNLKTLGSTATPVD